MGWSYMELGNWEEAYKAFKLVKHENKEKGLDMAKTALQGKDLPQRSPALAGILSGILPGCGA